MDWKLEMSKRWKCTVCGYIHLGETPPGICPVCGSDRSMFVPLDAEKSGPLHSLIANFKLHPVAAHFPNGLVPTAALFLLLYWVTDTSGFESASFRLIAVAILVVPVSMASGIYDWLKHFGGRRYSIFFKKIALALTLLTLGLVAISLRYGEPDLITSAGGARWVYFFCLLGMLNCVVLLGHYGSILASQAPALSRPEFKSPGGEIKQDWLQTLVMQAPDAIIAADSGGVIHLWNRGAERIFGIPADRAVGQSLDLIIPENQRQRHWAGWAEVMRTGASRYGEKLLRVPAIRGDGSRFSAEFSIVMLNDGTGRITGVAAILRDVSDQWEREKRLKMQLDSFLEKKRTT